MRTRFPKVWCEECRSMQFAGECPHVQRRDRTEPAARQREGEWRQECPGSKPGNIPALGGGELKRFLDGP